MFPSVLNTFNRPSATDRLNSPSHSALHNTVSSALGQVQAVIGLSTSSAVGTLFYDIRSPLSNGGGHVQTAVKGGTGQTTFTKGDLLVATSASVLSKLAVSTDGSFLKTNSSVAAGLEWSPASGKLSASGSLIGLTQNVENSILSVVVPGSTLGTNNVVRATVYIQADAGFNASVLSKAFYGGNNIASVLLVGTGLTGSVMGKFDYTIIGNNASNIQRVILQSNFTGHRTVLTANSSALSEMTFGSASVESSANQTMGMTWITSADIQPKVFSTVVEKIT